MLGRLTWGLVGFAAGAYIATQADASTRRTWRRQARRLGRRAEKVLRSTGGRLVNDAVDALTSK